MYYVYMIRCSDESLYTGITTNLKRRLQEHLNQSPKAAKYTRSHPIKQLEAFWVCNNRKQASQLEYWLKKLSKKQKEMIIENNINLKKYLNKQLRIEDYCRDIYAFDNDYDNMRIGDEKDDDKRSK
ncbi:GIY-YIG nuclease family protein [Candidatus Stoquefichus sp. SB1]|uniref:GIY-YIG nuclease family protein n=1 Tax=Candidatus Stoquefichus sp. SB1 TaxID=1658109 RepID=UPI00067F336F|nr:GIY-YIG nuclease family protein [Candidatus Stoquefichus sp. SB1]